jgi:hypothetical protein
MILCTALLLAACAQDSFETLVEKLGDSSIEVREEAEQELRRLGRKIVPDLRRVAEKHSDPEVRSRALSVVKALTEVRWWTDVASARKAANASGKRLLVFSTMGPVDGYV